MRVRVPPERAESLAVALNAMELPFYKYELGRVFGLGSLARRFISDIRPIVDVLVRHGAKLERVELAVDFDAEDAEAAAIVLWHICDRLRMRCPMSRGPWRRPRDETVYWHAVGNEIRVVAYCDTPSPITGGHRVHIEVRLVGARLLETLELRDPVGLLDIDEDLVFACVRRVVDLSPERRVGRPCSLDADRLLIAELLAMGNSPPEIFDTLRSAEHKLSRSAFYRIVRQVRTAPSFGILSRALRPSATNHASS